MKPGKIFFGFFVFFLLMTVAYFPLQASAGPSAEPGPNLETWQVDPQGRDWPNTIYRVYRNPQDVSLLASTLSPKVRENKSKILLLKLWNIRVEKNGAWDKSQAEAALRLPNGEWFIGDTGDSYAIFTEWGMYCVNLVVWVKKLDTRALGECYDKRARIDNEPSGVLTYNCDRFKTDKKYNGMYYSIPLGEYSHKK